MLTLDLEELHHLLVLLARCVLGELVHELAAVLQPHQRAQLGELLGLCLGVVERLLCVLNILDAHAESHLYSVFDQ